MLTLHHLNNSRSQRILWLLEELGSPYEIKRYQRNAETRLAPPELTKIHPLGKSPVITDGDTTIAESAAIVDYIIRRYGNGAMMRRREAGIGGCTPGPHIFDGNIRDNLRLARAERPTTSWRPPPRARLLPWIDSLSLGWDTPVAGAGPPCPAANGSGSRWPGRCSRIRPC